MNNVEDCDRLVRPEVAVDEGRDHKHRFYVHIQSTTGPCLL